MTRAVAMIAILACACSAPTWPEGTELVLRERSADTLGIIWDDAAGAASYVATIDGQQSQEITAPNVEARFEGLEESHLYLIEVVARSMFGEEAEPLRLQVRTRDGTPPVWPEGAELSYELTTAARFWWPEATDSVGVVGYVLRDADEPDSELQHVQTTEVVHDEPPPRRIQLVAVDAASNESEPLLVELTAEQASEFEVRRLEFHREVAETFEMSDVTEGGLPEGINGALLRELVQERQLNR